MLEPDMRIAVTECPCCDGELYRRVLLDERGVWALASESPEIQSDAKGHFMKCPHCSKRVVLIQAQVPGSGAGWALAPSQECDQKLP
jgi:hypothetical protein